LSISLTLQNLDYLLLEQDVGLLASLKMALAEAIAAEAGGGVLPAHVQLQLSAGSVHVLAEIHAPETVPLGQVRSRLETSATSASLGATVAANVAQVQRLSTVSTGGIVVSAVGISGGPCCDTSEGSSTTSTTAAHGGDGPSSETSPAGDAEGVARSCVRSVGALGHGVACQDGNSGVGYLMYSAHSVMDRFRAYPPQIHNAAHFVCVRYWGGVWQYDSNDAWHTFQIFPSDVLVAEVDFDVDTVGSLRGLHQEPYHGLTRGWASGDLAFQANVWNGLSNGGEFAVLGTSFSAPCPGVGTLPASSPEWVIGLWGPCSSSCGEGERRRQVRCLDGPDAWCAARSAMPPEHQVCWDHSACPHRTTCQLEGGFSCLAQRWLVLGSLFFVGASALFSSLACALRRCGCCERRCSNCWIHRPSPASTLLAYTRPSKPGVQADLFYHAARLLRLSYRFFRVDDGDCSGRDPRLCAVVWHDSDDAPGDLEISWPEAGPPALEPVTRLGDVLYVLNDAERQATIRNSHPLIGMWVYASDVSSGSFDISMSDGGQLYFKEEFNHLGLGVFGVLWEQGPWLRAELDFRDGRHYCSVRLCYVKDRGATLLNVMGPTDETWGSDIFARLMPSDALEAPWPALSLQWEPAPVLAPVADEVPVPLPVSATTTDEAPATDEAPVPPGGEEAPARAATTSSCPVSASIIPACGSSTAACSSSTAACGTPAASETWDESVTGVPLEIRVVSPNGQHAYTGDYELVGDEWPNGLPIWRQRDGTHLLYSGRSKRWCLGGQDVRKRNFDCSAGHIYCSQEHKNAMPHMVRGALWSRWDGAGFIEDPDISVFALPLSEDAAEEWRPRAPSPSVTAVLALPALPALLALPPAFPPPPTLLPLPPAVERDVSLPRFSL